MLQLEKQKKEEKAKMRQIEAREKYIQKTKAARTIDMVEETKRVNRVRIHLYLEISILQFYTSILIS